MLMNVSGIEFGTTDSSSILPKRIVCVPVVDRKTRCKIILHKYHRPEEGPIPCIDTRTLEDQNLKKKMACIMYIRLSIACCVCNLIDILTNTENP